MRRRRYRIAATGATLLVVAALTSGCSPEFHGQVGLTRDATGHLAAVIDTCGARRFDGADLIDGTVVQDHHERLGLWKHEGKLPRVATFSVAGDQPGAGWTTIRSWNGTVPHGHRYVLQAGRIDGDMVNQDRVVSYYFSFTSDDLDRLTSGMVLRRGPAAQPDSPVLQTLDEFVAHACADD